MPMLAGLLVNASRSSPLWKLPVMATVALARVVLSASLRVMPLSTAMTKTGAAERIATGLVDAIGDRGPYALLVGLFVLTAVMGQLISNMATALIVEAFCSCFQIFLLLAVFNDVN